MSGSARFALTQRLVIGVVLTAAAALSIAVGVSGGVGVGHTATPVAVTLTPAASDTVLTCAGPLLAVGRQSGDAGRIGIGAGAGTVSAGAHVARRTLGHPDVSGSGGPERLTAPAKTDPATVAGASSAAASADDLAGFAAADCGPALLDSWLVGGATVTGAADVVVLANPTAVAATVTLALYGANGATQPPAGRDIVVDAASSRAVPLASLGVDETAPIVHVSAEGAPVRATLQSSVVRGLAAGGVDQSSATAGPDTALVLPGIVTSGKTQGAPTTLVRLVSPDVAATATVTVPGASGKAGAGIRVSLAAGIPVEVRLDGLAAGVHTATVAASVPVVGAAWQATGLGQGDDFAWIPPAAALNGTAAFAVPAGPSPRLVLAGGDTATTVTVTRSGGSATKVAVPAHRTVTVSVSKGAYRLSAAGTVHAAVAFAGDGALATFPVSPAGPAASGITVHP